MAAHEPHWGSLEYYLPPYDWGWRAEHPPLPFEVVAWRKIRNGRWIAWTYYGRYSWANIKKWVAKRGDVYQVATANGQLFTIRRAACAHNTHPASGDE